MKFLVTYSGFIGANPISATTEIESISITGCTQNFCNRMRNKGVDIKKITIQELEEEKKDGTPR